MNYNPILQRIWRKFLRIFFHDQWVILLGANKKYDELSWNDLKYLKPPHDRFWADPFLWQKDGISYIFFEEFLYSNNRGRIVCASLDNEMNISNLETVLERPYHLSYPFIFEFDNNLFMIPETKENRTIEVYRCLRFPNRWAFETTLLDNLNAVDSTLLNHNGKWWLFVNIESTGSSYDSLFLFYSDNPLSATWTPHPHNPVINSIKSARPAGRIFADGNNLIRPSQDCSLRYGYAINFNKITTITELDYAEINLSTFRPNEKDRNIGTHTFNFTGNITAIDAMQRRSRFFE